MMISLPLSAKLNINLILLKKFFFTIGDRASMIALMSIMVDQKFILGIGIVSLLTALPDILFYRYIAKICDRYDERQVCIIASLCSGICILLIPCFLGNIYLIYGLYFVANSFSATYQIAVFKLYNYAVKQVKDSPKNIDHYNKITEYIRSLLGISAPVLTAILISLTNVKVAFYLDACTFFGAAITLLFISYAKELSNQSNLSTQKYNIKKFLAILASTKTFGYFFVIQAGMILITNGIGPFIYYFGVTYFNVTFTVSTIFGAAIGVGTALGAWLFGKINNYSRIKTAMIVGLADGVLLILLVLLENAYLGVILFMLTGVTITILTIITRSAKQIEIKEKDLNGVNSYSGLINNLLDIVSVVGATLLVKYVLTIEQLFVLCGGLEILLIAVLYGGYNFRRYQTTKSR